MSPGAYLAVFAGGVAGTVACAAALAMLADPFGIFTREVRTEAEQARPARNDNDRLIKLYDPLARPAALIFAGSSRTKQGLDPATVAPLAGATVYNAGIDGAQLEEVLRQAQFHARWVDGLRTIYVELFPLGPSLAPRGAAQPPSLAEHASNLALLALSASAQKAALDALLGRRAPAHASAPPFTRLSGFYPAVYACAGCRLEAFLDEAHWRRPAMDFAIGTDLLGVLRRTREAAATRGIEVRYYLGPVHAWVAYAYLARGSWQALERLKLELARLGGVHDFMRFGPVVEEPPAPRMKYWLETWHYSAELGRLMARAMLQRDAAPQGFGRLLEAATIESEIAAWRAERDAWARRNPHVIARYGRGPERMDSVRDGR